MEKEIKNLIIIDCQNDFVTGALGTSEAETAVSYINKLRENKSIKNIIYTMDSHNEDYLKTSEGKNLPIPHCIKNTNGWALCSQVYDFNFISETLASIFFIEKYTFGYNWYDFFSRRIFKYDGEKHSIYIVGLCTDICVITNALILKTLFPEVEIIVDAAGCAGTTPEKHEAALDVMESCQIKVINR